MALNTFTSTVEAAGAKPTGPHRCPTCGTTKPYLFVVHRADGGDVLPIIPGTLCDGMPAPVVTA